MTSIGGSKGDGLNSRITCQVKDVIKPAENITTTYRRTDEYSCVRLVRIPKSGHI
jgi:hypothetical protein